MNNHNVDDMIYKMTNFYQDRLPIDSSLEKLLKIYVRTTAMVQGEYRQIAANASLEESNTLDTIPYFKVEITDGLYSIERAQRIRLLSFEEMLREMDRNNEYVLFSFKEKGARSPIVYSLDLKMEFSSTQPLELYTHYFIRENRLYLLPDFILQKQRVLKYLHAFDIKVDRKKLEKNWGSLFTVEAGPLLPRYQYRDVLSAFQRTLMSDLTIKNITEGVRLATQWEEFKIEDIMTPTLSTAKKRLYDEWMLSPSKFIATLPEYLIKDKLRLNILLSLLDEVKEADKNYAVIFDVLRKDVIEIPDIDTRMISMSNRDLYTSIDIHSRALRMEWTDYLFNFAYDTGLLTYDTGDLYDNEPKNDFFFPTVNMNATDIGAFTDSIEVSKIQLQVSELFSFENQTVPYYDSGFSYDDDLEYDFTENNQFDTQDRFDQPKLHQTDRFYLRYVEFPEIPRQFTAKATGTSGVFEFNCRPNNDGTLTFDLLGSEEVDGEYTVLTSQANEEYLEKVTFIHNANTSGKRYYKIRAIAGSFKSFMTLPIDIETL